MNIMKSRVAAVAVGAAVLVTLGGAGGAVAGSLITTYDIKDYTVRGVDMRANSITSAKVKDGSLFSADIHDGTVTKADLSFNVPDASLMVFTATDSTAETDVYNDFGTLECPAGMVVIPQRTVDSDNAFFTVWPDNGSFSITGSDIDYWGDSNAAKDVTPVAVTAADASKVTIRIVCG